MNPEQLARSGTEHAEQMALFCWANMAANKGFAIADNMQMYSPGEHHKGAVFVPVPELHWMHAIPNAGARGNKIAASQLKAEGVKAGVADIFLPVVRLDHNAEFGNQFISLGLYIELKRLTGKPSDISDEQQKFAMFVSKQGYQWSVCFGWMQAAAVVKAYMNYAS